MANLLLKRIKDWATSIDSFRTGDEIPVDGPSGTAKMSKDDLLKVIAENGRNLVTMGRIGSAEDAQSAFGNTPDIDNAQNNTIYALAYSVGIAHLPINSGGTLITYTGNTSTDASSVQFYVSLENKLYYRGKWAKTWGDWKRVSTLADGDVPHTFGRIGSAEDAQSAFGNTPDIDNAAPNSIYAIAYSLNIAHLPVGAGGTLFTYTGNTASPASSVQFYVSLENKLYYRGKWAKTWGDWKRVNNDKKYTEVIATFEKIGACGGSFATGYSVYTDSGNTNHGINLPENSWVQLWGRKHGITAKNFSSAGWSIKDWFASADNIAAVDANPCKVYFTLFGGGNDIQDYDRMTGLGSISDVHVGSEDTNPHTFYGDYSRLIAKLQAVGGWHTKVISFTYGQVFNAGKDETQLAYIQAIHDVQALYSNVYAIDLMDDAELNSVKVSPYYYGGHYSAIGYKKIADRLEALVDKLVNDNPNNFADVQWIGTNYDIVQWY